MNNRQKHTFQKPFTTESGFSIAEPTVAYQTWGNLNREKDNVIIIFHALTGNTAADEWFSGLFGAGKVVDPECHFIICVNALGSCYGTTGPTSVNPETDEIYRANFPEVSIRDMVRLQQRLLNELEISSVELAIGGSMGGMQALEFCIMDDRPQAAVFIGMGKNHSPWAIGISHAQRQAIYNDPNWNGGFYSDENRPNQGLALAREIAMTSYRHPGDYEQKFARNRQDESNQFQIESYLNYQGKKLTERFDAVAYERLTKAMDTHDVARGRASYKQVLGNITIPTLVIGINSDLLYPPQEQHELAHLLPNSRYRKLTSRHGHDAFLIEFDQLRHIINPFLIETPTSLAI